MEDLPIDQIISKVEAIRNEALKKIEDSKSIKQIDDIRIEFLGRKSSLTDVLKNIRSLDDEGKKKIGQRSNFIKKEIENKLIVKRGSILIEKFKNIDDTEKIDVTLPGEIKKLGSKNPINSTIREIEDIFMRMGFEVYYPYLLDDDYHNFESLNMPKEHPARDSWDTFWSEDGHIAITHTSSMQNRILRNSKLPVRAIAVGRCFRNEATDARHEHTFNQVEGVYLDKGITLPDMLGTLKEFFSKYYEKDIEVKFTPDYFPFVEPGGMMSLSCILCNGRGCNVCKKSGWLELLGCGMIHPKVIEMAGIDPKTYYGFAFGVGIERLIMLKYNINDIRLFHSGDLKFIHQF